MKGLHTLLELLLLLLMALFLAEFKERLLQSWLQTHGLAGTITFDSPECIRIQNPSYRHHQLARELLVCLDYPGLLRGDLALTRLLVHDLDLNALQKLLPKKKGPRSQSPKIAIPIQIHSFHLDGFYRYQGLNRFELIGHDATLHRGWIDRLWVQTFAATLQAHGHYQGDQLQLQGLIEPEAIYLAKWLPPQLDPRGLKKLIFTTTITPKALHYTLTAHARKLYRDANLSLLSQGTFTYATAHLTSQNQLSLTIARSQARATFDLEYDGTIHVQGRGLVENRPYDLPLKPSFYRRIAIEFQGTPDHFILQADNGSCQLEASLQKASATFTTSPIPLQALFDPPQPLAKSAIAIKGKWQKGKLQLQLDSSQLGQARITYSNDILQAKANLYSLPQIRLAALNPIQLQADFKTKRAQISTALFQGTLSQEDGQIHATIKIAKSTIQLTYRHDLKLKGYITSLKALGATLAQLLPTIQVPNFDAKLLVQGRLEPKKMVYRLKISSPWRPPKEAIGLGFFDLQLHGNRQELFIDYYAATFADHAFYATKTSRIRFENGAIILDPLWIEDRIRVTGRYAKGRGSFDLEAQDYHYSSIEGSITLDAALDILLNQGRIKVQGNLLLKGGTITMAPKQKGSIQDPDIVILDQFGQEPKANFFQESVALEIKVESQKPIHYKLPDLELSLKPDLLIWKEYQKELQLLGYIHIVEGTYRPLGEYYKILPSDLYFYGKPTDPLLDLRIKTKKESYTIYITISGTLTNPILRFDSDPYLPPKDILTLLIMGSNSSLLLKSSAGDRLAGALGNLFLKNMLSSFGIELDTLTLTSNDGRLGFEIGKRLGDKIMVIYKNDTVSTIIIRYEMSDHIESELIFGPQKSGVNIFYRKQR
ncbi:MAG: hypothetical protein C6I00_05830 [Nitratiruptor sp.]|nr:hypothetical protein [Nitratiruptor sp.]NPA83618.1 hypothetical protein [Campylobacterota bacterium]